MLININTIVHLLIIAGLTLMVNTAPSYAQESLSQDYRQHWFRMNQLELSSLHWQQFVTVYINQSADIYRHNYLQYIRLTQDDLDDHEDDEMSDQFKPYPPGTMITKEGYQNDRQDSEPLFIVIMKKHPPGYDPQFGDWEYIKMTFDGKTLLKGKSSTPQIQNQCAHCHLNVADRDFIFSSIYDEPK